MVGLKKLLGSEALAGVRLALTPEVGGRADAEAVSSAPAPSLAVLDPGDPRPAGEYARLSGEGEQTLGLGLAWHRLCRTWEILGPQWNASGGGVASLDLDQEGADRFSTPSSSSGTVVVRGLLKVGR